MNHPLTPVMANGDAGSISSTTMSESQALYADTKPSIAEGESFKFMPGPRSLIGRINNSYPQIWITSNSEICLFPPA